MNIWNKMSAIVFMSAFSAQVFAQIPDKVGSLINADKEAALISKTTTPHQAFLSIVDKESKFFVPSEVYALDYLNNRPNIPDVLTWEPALAMVSKSQEFGVTTGPMEFQKVGARKRFGQYLTVWKRNKKGKWLVDIRAEVENFGNKENSELEFYEPSEAWYLKHRSQVRLDQRKEIVFETDKLLSTVLKADNQAGYKEFLNEDARFLFPWIQPIEGKKEILAYLKKSRINILTTPEKVGRAYSGEYAYSFGTATVNIKDKVVKYNYIRIWKLSELAKDDVSKANWNILVEMMFER